MLDYVYWLLETFPEEISLKMCVVQIGRRNDTIERHEFCCPNKFNKFIILLKVVNILISDSGGAGGWPN